MATSTSPPILHAAQIGVIPNELRSAAVFQPIAVHGLDTQGHHKRIWDLFTSNRRADRLPLHFYAIQADHRFPLAKAKAAGVEPSLSSGILRTNWVTKHCRDVPAVAVLFVELDWASADWAERVEAQGHGTTHEEEVPSRDRAREMLLMGLRLAEGIDPVRIEARSGVPFAAAIDPAMLAALIDEDYLAWTPQGRLRATEEGILRLDALLPVLLR